MSDRYFENVRGRFYVSRSLIVAFMKNYCLIKTSEFNKLPIFIAKNAESRLRRKSGEGIDDSGKCSVGSAQNGETKKENLSAEITKNAGKSCVFSYVSKRKVYYSEIFKQYFGSDQYQYYTAGKFCLGFVFRAEKVSYEQSEHGYNTRYYAY